MICSTAVKNIPSHLALPSACCHIDVSHPFMEDFSIQAQVGMTSIGS